MGIEATFRYILFSSLYLMTLPNQTVFFPDHKPKLKSLSLSSTLELLELKLE